MTVTKLRFVKPRGRKPVYMHYPGQLHPQPAYIELDCRARTVLACYNAEIGTAVPLAVWHGLVRRYAIPPDATCKQINALMHALRPSFERICDSINIYWDGNNTVGRLSGDDVEIEYEIDDIISEYFES